MSKKYISLVALAALLSACSAAATQNVASVEQVSPASPPRVEAPPALQIALEPSAHARRASYDDAAVTCDVRSQRTSNGVLIQARLFADRDVDAEYDLRIVKSGGGNSSEINQSGEVSLTAGSSATLGENELSVERGSRVRAYLTIRDAHGQICQLSFRL